MPRLFFECAYDGSSYCGWQSQKGGESVQDVIEAAMGRILKRPVRISASGRTDAGVHAYAQCFHADVPETCRMQPENWLAALNAHLPGSIRITSAREVSGGFHARFNAVGKIYEYVICNAPVLSPFMQNRAWHIPHSFDASLLEEALHVYEGEHDFRRFAANRGNEPADPPADFYIRTIYQTGVRKEGQTLRLHFHGNGFMYRMVRLLVGTAHQVSRGKLTLQQLEQMLNQPLGEKTRYCAPAEGLYLKQVFYQ